MEESVDFRSALQTDLQGVTGTMLKSADDTHVQLVPSCCDAFLSLSHTPKDWDSARNIGSRRKDQFLLTSARVAPIARSTSGSRVSSGPLGKCPVSPHTSEF
ncbi:MAG: hypothetical protein AAFO72_10520, partial [Pseudomonadota bacterium]